jgi:hypothetical protein
VELSLPIEGEINWEGLAASQLPRRVRETKAPCAIGADAHDKIDAAGVCGARIAAGELPEFSSVNAPHFQFPTLIEPNGPLGRGGGTNCECCNCQRAQNSTIHIAPQAMGANFQRAAGSTNAVNLPYNTILANPSRSKLLILWRSLRKFTRCLISISLPSFARRNFALGVNAFRLLVANC